MASHSIVQASVLFTNHSLCLCQNASFHNSFARREVQVLYMWLRCSYSNKLLSGWWLIWLYNNFTMDMLWEGVTQQTIVKLCLDLRHVTTDHWPHDGVTELTLTWDMVTVGSWHHIRYQLLPTAAADPCTYHAPQSSVSQYYLLLHWQTLINASE